MSQTKKEIQRYRKDHPDFGDIGRSMIEQWEIGMQQSLRDV